MNKPGLLMAIDQLEESIRVGFPPWKPPHAYMNIGGPLTARQYEDVITPGTNMNPRDAAQHALWLLDRAREYADSEEYPDSSNLLCAMHVVGIACGMVLPYGILAAVTIEGFVINPAIISKTFTGYEPPHETN